MTLLHKFPSIPADEGSFLCHCFPHCANLLTTIEANLPPTVLVSSLTDSLTLQFVGSPSVLRLFFFFESECALNWLCLRGKKIGCVQ